MFHRARPHVEQIISSTHRNASASWVHRPWPRNRYPSPCLAAGRLVQRTDTAPFSPATCVALGNSQGHGGEDETASVPAALGGGEVDRVGPGRERACPGNPRVMAPAPTLRGCQEATAGGEWLRGNAASGNVAMSLCSPALTSPVCRSPSAGCRSLAAFAVRRDQNRPESTGWEAGRRRAQVGGVQPER